MINQIEGNMKKIVFLILTLEITIGCFAQSPYINLYVNGINTECKKTIGDTCHYYSCMKLQYDSIRISAVFPQMYLQQADSINLIIDTLSKKGTLKTTYLRRSGMYTMSRYIPGVCASCSVPQYDISIIFIGTTNMFDDSVKIIRWEDNYAYTGGFWERCGLSTNITSPYRISKPNSQIIYSFYEAIGCCDETPECGTSIGRIHQFFDCKGRCNKEVMGDVTVLYNYNIWGKLKEELWYEHDSILTMTVNYSYRKRGKETTYWMKSSGDKMSIITKKTNRGIEERCYNENGAQLWIRLTSNDFSHMESVTVINGNNNLLYKKEYEKDRNVISEYFEGNNSYTSYDYIRGDDLEDWKRVIQYEVRNDVKIPIIIVDKKVIQ